MQFSGVDGAGRGIDLQDVGFADQAVERQLVDGLATLDEMRRSIHVGPSVGSEIQLATVTGSPASRD